MDASEVKFFLFKIGVTILVEFLILLFFFKKDWKQCLHFAVIVNLVTTIAGTMIVTYFAIDWRIVQVFIGLFEAIAIYMFWVIGFWRALALSYILALSSTLALLGLHELGLKDWFN